jgi:hypothetical protein
LKFQPVRLQLRSDKNDFDRKRAKTWLTSGGDRIADFPDHAQKIVSRDAESFGPGTDLRGVGQIKPVASG